MASTSDAQKSAGLMSFEITDANDRKLKAILAYMRFVDSVAASALGESTSADGVINSIIDEATSRVIKSLRMRHGFDGEMDFVAQMLECREIADVKAAVESAEMAAYERLQADILRHMPVDDGQMDLPFDAKKGA